MTALRRASGGHWLALRGAIAVEREPMERVRRRLRGLSGGGMRRCAGTGAHGGHQHNRASRKGRRDPERQLVTAGERSGAAVALRKQIVGAR